MTRREPTPNRNSLVFGFALDSDIDLGVEFPPSDRPDPDLQLLVRDATELSEPEDGLLYSSDSTGREAGVTAYRDNNRAVVRFRGVDLFTIAEDTIECALLSRAYEYLVPIQFLGIVMALWMELRGIPVLHASGATIDSRGVAFLASKRGGKTTLAAAMAKAGHPMLSDDLTPIQTVGDTPFVRPGYPQLRMEPDVASHFVNAWQSLPIVHPDHEKRHVPLSKLGRFQPRASPLVTIYLPQRVEGTDIQITPLSGLDALAELLGSSFLPEMVAGFGLEAKRLPILGAIANTVPMKRLLYPPGLDQLADVVAAIEHDIGG